MNKMWDYSLFIEQDLSDKKYLALSESVVLAVNSVLQLPKTSLQV